MLFLSGCAGVFDPQKDDAVQIEAEAVIASLKTVNSGMQTFKGIGKVTVDRQDEVLSAGVAWMGTNSGKLRLEVLGLLGQSLMSLAADGTYIYFLSQQPPRFVRHAASEVNLKSMISIPVTSGETAMILSGRIPVRKYSYAVFETDDNGTGDILTLKSWWGNPVQKICFQRNETLVQKIEFFSEGQFEFSASFSGVKSVESYRIPFGIEFISDDGSALRLAVRHFWADVSVNEASFELNPPEDRKNLSR